MGKRRMRRAERAAAERAEAEAVSTWLAEVSDVSDDVFGGTTWRANRAPDPSRWHPSMGDEGDTRYLRSV
jgi:hypothetical protein